MAYRTLDTDHLLLRVQQAAAAWHTDAGVSYLESIHGGASGVTFALTLQVGDRPRRAVLKVAPAGLEPVRNRDVLRQAEVQRALADVDGFPVPEILFSASGDGLDNPPFYVMDRLEGECYEPLLDHEWAGVAVAEFNARAFSLIAAMVRLHGVPVAQLPAGARLRSVSLEEEVATWQRALGSVGGEVLELDHTALTGEAGRRLLQHVPADLPTGPRLVHGDLRLGNALFAGKTLTAVIDWEISHVGHPLLDLAWMCSFLDSNCLVTRVRDLAGLVEPAQLATQYAELSGLAVGSLLDDLSWFTALVCFKQAAATALIVKNNRNRPDPDPHLIALGPKVSAYLERVLELVPA